MTILGSPGLTTEGRGRLEPSSLVDLLLDRARRTPEAEAFRWLGGDADGVASLTFGDLDQRARVIARAVATDGLVGERVVLAFDSGLELVAALFGCFYAGAVPLVASVASAREAERFRSIVIDAGAVGMLVDESPASKEMQEISQGLRVLSTKYLVGDGDLEPPRPANPQALAMLQYTSGSTAAPRGVMLTHLNLLENLRVLRDTFQISEGETVVSWLPFFHDMGLIIFGLLTVYVGFRSVLMPPIAFVKHPVRWLEAISEHRAVFSVAPGFAFDLCTRRVTADQRAKLDLYSWRSAVCGSEMIRPATLENFSEAFGSAGFRRDAFMPGYGLAECTLIVACTDARQGFAVVPVDGPTLRLGRAEPPVSAERQRDLTICGPARPGIEAIVVHADLLTKLPPGEIGEIWVRGASVSPGYWRRPEESAEIFNRALADDPSSTGWLRTGDLGFLRDGALVLTGRRKDMIIARGVNFDPLDIELTVEASHAALAPGLSAAFSFDHADGEKIVVAAEVKRSAVESLDANEVVASVAVAMSRKMGLALYDLVLLQPGSLPRTTSGKLQRQPCRRLYLEGSLAGLDPAPHPELGRWRRGAS